MTLVTSTLGSSRPSATVTIRPQLRSVLWMRQHPLFAVLAVLAVGCDTGSDDSVRSTTGPDVKHVNPPPAVAKAGPWRITADVEPRRIGPVVQSVESLDARRSSSRGGRPPIVRGKLSFRNTAEDALRLDPIDYSAFSDDEVSGEQLLLAEGQCGYGMDRPGAPAEPGVCTLALLPPTQIRPGATETRAFAVFGGLPGMAPLEAGRYEFTRPVEFEVDEPSQEAAKRSTDSTIVIDVRRR